MVETKAPSGAAPAPGGYTIVMPPEMHIPVTAQDIVEIFRNKVDTSEKSQFNDVCKLIEACSMTELMGIRARVKKNFRLFSAAALRRPLPMRRGRQLPKEASMDEQELVFLKDFFELMDITHYNCLKESEWIAARSERFLLDMPIKVNWDYMDSRMLSRFFKRHPERRAGLYCNAERCLIFTRGVGVIRKEDLYIPQKIDLLVDYLVAQPAKKVWAYLWPRLSYLMRGKKKTETAEAVVDRIKGLVDAKGLRDGSTALDAMKALASGKKTDGEPVMLAGQHKHAKVVSRQSLRLMLPTWRSVLGSLHKKLTIIEPTYKDIVTLYRKKVSPPTEKETKANPACISDFRMAQRNIVIKRFDELPIADLEVLLPDKSVGLKLVDLLTLYGTAIAAIIGGVTAFFGASVELGVIMSTLSVMGGKLMQTYTSMQQKKAELVKQMSLKVYDISLDAQEGVLFSILDEMSDQYVKEMLLAYFVLYKHNEPLTQEELDNMCEDFLDDKFDIKIDFAMDDSMPRLLSTGLVTKNPIDDSFRAVRLEEAQALLMRKWTRAFSYDDSDNVSLSAAMTAGVTGGLTSVTAGFSNPFGKMFGSSHKEPKAHEVEHSSPSVSKRKWFHRRKHHDASTHAS